MRDFESLYKTHRHSPFIGKMLLSPFLRELGWNLIGEDVHIEKSRYDIYKYNITETFTWAGFATKGNCVLDADGYGCSGAPFYKSRVFQVHCNLCDGSGIHPSKLTFSEAQADPQKYYATFKDEREYSCCISTSVRDILEKDQMIREGQFKSEEPRYLICDDCEGKGYLERSEKYIHEYLPVFNFKHRPRTNWQLEIDGEYLASGAGFSKLNPFSKCYYNLRFKETEIEIKKAAKKLAEKITSIADKAMQRKRSQREVVAG